MYLEVLSLSKAKKGVSEVDWALVFEDSSLYKQIYKQEIIVAVMEAGNLGSDDKRVMFIEEQKIAANYSMGATGGQSGAAAAADNDGEENKEEESTQDATQASTED